MPEIKRTAKAEGDLIDIWVYIAQDNVSAADRLLDRIEEKFFVLAEQPRLGPRRPDIAPELRYFPVGNYLILYREISAGVEIVRLFTARVG
ncbi:type II toxin-antitoxin system RelE/ParE family toxin [Candidatus Thiosymbion oneisti]|uniref:type II toxin-antitoxin system RelE/ParE family toxin n=1 Tax=Candidatus Thiosymbion oneisti TaxID=589554 RepID=UPI001A9C42D0|nr:type II toxin-antitoxin system RelE/ParE family toxin [Candidatus Thiosymbion oneisti]